METYYSKYDSIGDFNQGVAIVVKNGLYGAILMGGHEIIAPTYEYMTPFVNGFAQAIRYDQCKIIDLSGREHDMLGNIKPLETDRYDGIRDFKCGLACVVKDGKWGVVDSNYKEIIPLNFSYISDFVAGTAILNDTFQWGYTDLQGRITTCPSRPILENDGSLVVCRELPASQFVTIESSDNKLPFEKKNVRINNSGQVLVYNETSQVALPHICIYGRNFKCGLSCIQNTKGFWGAIDINGRFVIQPQYSVIQDFSENLSFAKSEDQKIHLLNAKGERIKTFDSLFVPSPFTNGYSQIYKDGKWGIMNNIGEILLQPLADKIVTSEQPDIFTLKNKNNKIGYFNAATRRLILPLYDKILSIDDHGASVEISGFGSFRIDRESKPTIPNKENSWILPQWCIGIIALNERYYKVISNSDQVGIFSNEGKEIISPSYSDIALWSDHFYVRTGQYCGIVNKQERVLLPTDFQELKSYAHGIFFKQDGRWGVMKPDFEVIHDAEFDLITKMEDGYYRTTKRETHYYATTSKNEIPHYYGILDEYGHEKLSAIYSKIENPDSSGRGFITFNKLLGIIDLQYHIIAEPQYGSILNFKEGKAIAEKKDLYKIKIGTLDIHGNFEEKPIDELLNYPVNTIIEDLSDFHTVAVHKNGCKIIQLNTSEAENRLCGVIDLNNKVVCPLIYNSILLTSKGNYKVCKNKKYGLLDENFQVLIPLEYGDLLEFNNALIAYKWPSFFHRNTVGLFSFSGKNLLPLVYSDIKDATPDLYWIYTDSNQNVGLADRKGKILIAPQYGKVEPFIDGFAMVNKGRWYVSSKTPYGDQSQVNVSEYQEGYWGVINSEGIEIITPQYSKITFHPEDQTFEVVKDDRTGRLDKHGNLIIRSITGQDILACTKYDWQEDFGTNNLSVIYFKGEKAYLNSDMNLVVTIVSEGSESLVEIPSSYDWAEYLIQDFIKVKKNGKFGIIDKNLKNVVDVTFDHISLIQDKESFAFICGKNEENTHTHISEMCFSLYDRYGNTILPYITDDIKDLGFGFFTAKGPNGKFVIYNIEGDQLFNESYDTVYPFDILRNTKSDWGESSEKNKYENFAIVVKDERYGAIFKDGVSFVPCKYKTLGNTEYESFHTIGKLADLNNQSIVSDGINRCSYWSDGNTKEDIRLLLNNSVYSANRSRVNLKDKGYKFCKCINDDYLIVTKDDLYGCINITGDIIIPIKYISLDGNGNYFTAFRMNDQTKCCEAGVLNLNNDIVIPFDKKHQQFVFKSNFILYKSPWKWGAYSLYGNLIIEAQYDEIHQISEKLLKVGKKEGLYKSYLLWGIKDFKGNEILPIEYNEISDHVINDLIEVVKDRKIGYLRKDGNWVLEPRYESINAFNDGYAIVSRKMNNYGVIDNHYREIIPCVFYQIKYLQDLGLFETSNGYKTKNGEFIADNNGCKILIPSKYTYCLDFINNISITVCDLGYKRKYGLIDDCNNEIFPPIFDKLEYIDANVYKFGLYVGDMKFGLLNSSGKILVPNIYDTIGNFDNGVAYVNIKGPKTDQLKGGFINLDGEEILPVSYEYVGKRNGMYSIVMSNGIWRIFNIVEHTLVTVLEAVYIGACKEGTCKVNVGGEKKMNRIYGGKWGYINVLGEKIIPTLYDYAYNFSEGIAAVRFEGKVGLIDISGKIIVPFIYEAVESPCVNGYWKLIKEDEIFVFNKKGEIIRSYSKEDEYYTDY